MGNKETKYAHSITSPIICDSCAFSFCTFSRQINIRLASFHSRTKERMNSKIMLSPTELISFSTFAVRYATFMAVISTADSLVNHKRNYLKKWTKKLLQISAKNSTMKKTCLRITPISARRRFFGANVTQKHHSLSSSQWYCWQIVTQNLSSIGFFFVSFFFWHIVNWAMNWINIHVCVRTYP